jgi:hypothetical protein
MHRSKSRTRAKAATRARRSSLSPALPSPASVAPAVAATVGTGAPLAADALRVVDLLDAHLDRLHGVHSVLWAMTALLDRAAGETTLPRATRFQLQQLAKAGLGLAGESVDALACERRAFDAGEFH